LAFTGTQYITIADSSELDAVCAVNIARTVEVLLKYTTTSNTVISEKGTNSHVVLQTKGGGSAGRTGFRANNPSSGDVVTALLNDDSWHHITGKHTGVDVQNFISYDGTNVGPISGTSSAGNNDALVIGSRSGSFGYPGSMAEYRLRQGSVSDNWSDTVQENQLATTAWGTVGDWEEPGGGITGSGSPQAETATSSGTGIRTITGDGTPTATTATASGEGEVSGGITGFGDVQADTATTSGTGEITRVGSGSPQADTATSVGQGVRVITGGGSPQAETATTEGEGGVGTTGSGSPQAETATASGQGTRIITGDGSPVATTATVIGSGLRVITGTSEAQADTATSTGEGNRTIFGSGSPQANTAFTLGSGTVGDVQESPKVTYLLSLWDIY
jgi:hypothetical protein